MRKKGVMKVNKQYNRNKGDIGAKGYTVNIAELMEERDMLALENKHLARHLLQNGHTKNEVDSIAKGFKDWKEKGREMENKDKLVCSSCGESSDKEDFTMDEDYDYDVCDTCYQENYGK